jgi:hypothetical protein
MGGGDGNGRRVLTIPATAEDSLRETWESPVNTIDERG